MNKLFGICLLFLVVLMACHKKEVEISKFPVTATQGNNKVTLSWSPISFSDFKNVSIYRSASPIPDPEFGKSIDGTLQIGLISDKSVTSFVDSNMIMNSTGTSYYKVVVTFGSRFIVSDLITVTRNGFSMVMTTTSNSSTMLRFPEIHTMYYVDYNMGTIRAIDYVNKTLSNPSIFLNVSGSMFCTAINNGQPEFFVLNNNLTLYCFNATTMALKYNFSLNSSVNSFCVKNNYLYTFVNNYIYTYDLATKSLINSKWLNFSFNTYTGKLFPGPNNSLFFRYYTSNYNSPSGQYSYVNTVKIYKLSGGIPADSTAIPPMVLNTDTFTSNYNYSYINLSPDGQYLTLNQYGDVYSLQTHSTHSVLTAGNFWNVSFSADGQYLVARPNANSNGYSVGVFSLPAFNHVSTLRSGNLGSSNFVDDFTTHDTLVSYNLTSVFQNGQFQQTLNVAFNKIN